MSKTRARTAGAADSKKTIVLVDPLAGGHHLSFLRLFCEMAVLRGWKVITLSAEADQFSAWIANRYPEKSADIWTGRIGLIELSGLPGGKAAQTLKSLARWIQVRTAIRRAVSSTGWQPELILFTWLDAYLRNTTALVDSLIDSVFPFRWSGLYFHPTQFRRASLGGSGRNHQRHKLLEAENCIGVAVLDEGVREAIARAIGKPAIWFPDIVDDETCDPRFPPALAAAQAAGGRKIVGLIGSLEKRKGLLPLLEAAKLPQSEDCFFVFAGELVAESFTEAELRCVRAAAGPGGLPNVLFQPGRIPDSPQFNAMIACCDVIYAAYLDFPHSSNLIARAALFRKPLIVTSGDCMAERVSRYRLGEIIPEGRADEAAKAIGHLIGTSQLNADYEGFLRENSREKFVFAFQSLLDLLPV